jgi:phosphate transport system substrate-binding protein
VGFFLRFRSLTAFLITLLVSFGLSLPASADQVINVTGTTNLAPVLAQAAKEYQASHPGVTINVMGTSSGAGIAALKDHAVDVAMSDVAVDDDGFSDAVLGAVGFAFVANPDAGIKNLTREQLTEIFAGKITNWKAIGGNDRPIVLVGREIGTGTRFVFEDKVAKTMVPIRVEPNAAAVLKTVAETSGALGYLASGFLDNHQSLVVTYQSVAPTPENIRANRYSFATNEHLYTSKDAAPGVAAFVQYVKNDAKLLQANGIY